VYHQVKDLQDLSLQRLTQVLARVDYRQAQATSESAALIQHVYRDILPLKFSKDGVRNLVSQFAAIKLDQLVHGEFETLLEEGGDFVLDVNRKGSQHLRSFRSHILLAEKHMHELENEVQTPKEAAQKREDVLDPSDGWGAFHTTARKKNHR